MWALACGEHERPVFKLLDPSETGVTFANTIKADDSLNVQTDVYVYNGAGVAVGDVDGDGLPDIFFAGNKVSSRLYHNKGHMRFEDVTEKAGVSTHTWATGVSMVDINGDGALDIYVSVSGPEWSTPAQRANLLFVNDGKGHFTEQAAKYGIADSGFTTHAAFLDYDGDGCLDLFVLNNSPSDFTRGDVASLPVGRAVARRRTASTTSIGTTATATSPTCPSRPASSASRATDSASSSPISTATAGRTSTSPTTSSRTTSSTSTTATGPSPTSARSGSVTPASPAWASTSPTSTTTAGPTSCRST